MKRGRVLQLLALTGNSFAAARRSGESVPFAAVAATAEALELYQQLAAQDALLTGLHPLHRLYDRKMDPALRRATRENSLPYEWTPAFRRWLKNTYNNSCAYCGRKNCEFHVDHIVPVSWDACPGATVDNAVWVCGSCNVDRGNAALLDWLVATFGHARANQVVQRIQAKTEIARQRWANEREKMQAEGKQLTTRRLRRLQKRK